MSANRPRPINEERPFALDELFFSITDPRGVIRHGNGVFVRVSGYQERDLIGAPHNIIRHPDMPRAVFHLLWDYIGAGRTIAAYVKNLARDGRYYWVLATVMPCPGGYLSVRLKPSSPLLRTVEHVYRQALGVEQAVEVEPAQRKQAIAAGADSLLQQLAAAGFASYDDFMQRALVAEIASRRDELTRRASMGSDRASRLASSGALSSLGRSQQLAHGCRRIHGNLASMFASLEQLKLLRGDFQVAAEELQQTSTWIRNASLNAAITSHKLGASGHVLAVIARLLRDCSSQTISAVVKLSDDMETLSRRLGGLAFDVAVAELQVEVCTFFADELGAARHRGYAAEVTSDPLTEASLVTLLEQLDVRIDAAYRSAAEMCRQLNGIRAPMSELGRLLSEMQLIQFYGRKESLAHPQGANFAVVFEDIACRVKDSSRVCTATGGAVAACAAMLAEAVKGQGGVVRDLDEAMRTAHGQTLALA